MGKRDENKERKRDRITEKEIERNKETQKERELKRNIKSNRVTQKERYEVRKRCRKQRNIKKEGLKEK